MHNPSELISRQWAIDINYARAWYPILLQMFSGSRQVNFGGTSVTDARELSQSRQSSRPYFVAAFNQGQAQTITIDDSIRALQDAPDGSIAIVPVSGPIIKEDGLSSIGTATKGNFMKSIFASPKIAGVVLDIDSGGGEVNGTMSFANIIKQRNKPVVAHVNGIAASAAYWIAMQADAILLNNPTSQVGSIGVMMTFLDDSKYWEDMGVKWIDIVAKGSEDKNKGYFDALKGNMQTIKSESLNPLREMFASAVIEARGGKIDLTLENVLSGKMYFGAQTAAGNKSAIEVGLADEVGDLAQAVSKALLLADTSKYRTQTINNLF